MSESGTQKTPAFQAALKPVYAMQERMLAAYRDERAYYEKALADRPRQRGKRPEAIEGCEAPSLKRLVVSDATIERLAKLLESAPCGLILARDELNGWLSSFEKYNGKSGGAPDTSHWLSLYGGTTLIVDRQNLEQPTLYVPYATLSIIGGIQPGILRKAVGAAHRHSGLAARILLAAPPRRPKQWTEAGISPGVEADYAGMLNALADMEMAIGEDGLPEPNLIYLSPQAKEAYIEFYNRHNDEAAELEGDAAASWSKLEEVPARLALAHHLARLASGDDAPADPFLVDERSLHAGMIATEWFKREATRVNGLFDESEDQRQVRRIVEWIAHRGGSATARDIQRGLARIDSADEGGRALRSVRDAGYGYIEDVPPGKKGGPPTRRLHLFDWGDVGTTSEYRDMEGVASAASNTLRTA